MSKIPALLFAVTFFLVSMLIFLSWEAPDTVVALQQETPTPVVPSMPPSNDDSWIIIDLPATATQLEYGAEVYRLVCKACHGDKGQGLTDDWRAQWSPEDQNCWQSKCHAANHPPEGFYMPIAPAVVGLPVQIFDTALDLFNYIHNFMPWHNRGSMTEKDSWSVTAYILKMNNIEPGVELNPMTADQIRLDEDDLFPETSTSEVNPDLDSANEEQASQQMQKTTLFWTVALIVVVLLIFIGILFLYRRVIS